MGMATLTPTIVHINANLQWKCIRTKEGNYIGVCDPLRITLQADTFAELTEEINISLDALLKDLLSEGELEKFLRDQGWSAVGPIPVRPANIRFDVPFSIEAAGTNGKQTILHK